MNDLIKIAQECPSLNLTVQAGDLLEMVNHCVLMTRRELEQQIAGTSDRRETYSSPEQVARILDVDKSTLL
jgi:hypothetical protein